MRGRGCGDDTARRKEVAVSNRLASRLKIIIPDSARDYGVKRQVLELKPGPSWAADLEVLSV